MARVSGPLMSVDASGKFGGTLVYSKWKGRNYVRQLVTPMNPKAAKQLGVRSVFAFCAAVWGDLSAQIKATWEALATQKAISPFNAYMSENCNRWQNFFGPTQEYPADEASTPLTITTQTLTGGVGEVTLAITPSGSTSIWGFAIFRDTAEITTPSWSNCIAMIPADGANAVTYVDTPLEAGTYHYRVGTVQTDGKKGTIHADGSAVVT
jgi:hypothetical protein